VYVGYRGRIRRANMNALEWHIEIEDNHNFTQVFVLSNPVERWAMVYESIDHYFKEEELPLMTLKTGDSLTIKLCVKAWMKGYSQACSDM
jgi:hypothetical protein